MRASPGGTDTLNVPDPSPGFRAKVDFCNEIQRRVRSGEITKTNFEDWLAVRDRNDPHWRGVVLRTIQFWENDPRNREVPA